MNDAQVVFLIWLFLNLIVVVTGFPYTHYTRSTFIPQDPPTRGTNTFEKNADAYLRWIESLPAEINTVAGKCREKDGE